MNIEKLGNSEKLKFPFWVEGTFGDNIWWGGGRGGAGWPVGVGLVGAGGAMAGSQMGQGQWGQGGTDDWGGTGWQGAGGPDDSYWGWGRRRVVGQEGQIAGVGLAGGGWQGARWGRGSGGKEGQMAREGGWQGAGEPDGSFCQ